MLDLITPKTLSSSLSLSDLMPFSKLKRLLTARKEWRLFIAILQTKLIHRRSKSSIKKNRRHLKTSTNKPRFWSALSLQSHFKRRRRVNKPTHHHLHLRRLQKSPTPVYIDDLFKEPESVLKKESLQPEAKKKITKNEEGSNGRNQTATRSTAADDMWESLALASPQMYGINERSEEFITRFRAEMRLQESLARRL